MDKIRIALAAAGLAALALACAKPRPAAPHEPAPGMAARVESEPGAANVALDGKAMGETPLVLRIAAFDDLLKVSALSGGREPVEKRVRVISEKEAEIRFVFEGGRSAMAKALGLPKILVFEYGASPTFDVDRYDLKAEFLPLLQRQARLLTVHFRNVPVYVCGHTDSTGEAAHNLKLSLERAQAVADYLSGQGVTTGLLRVQGFGSDYPLAPNETAEGRALNRRTEVVLPQ